MKEKQIYEVNAEDFATAIRETLGEIASDNIYSRFEGRIVSTETACEVLGVSQRTLYRYIGAGLIAPQERGDNEDYKFNLRTLLETNVMKHKHTKTWKKSENLSKKPTLVTR